MQFPVGRTRLETVAVIVCAVIMSIATVLVIRESIGALVDGLAHRKSQSSLVLPDASSSVAYVMFVLNNTLPWSDQLGCVSSVSH